MISIKTNVKKYISSKHPVFFVIYTSIAAFSTYSCMYAFRKPFTVASFEGYYFLGADLKIWLITAQVIGYTISKFAGIKIVSELRPSQRAISILSLIALSEIGLFAFYKLPLPFNIIGMFINGLPLGIIWGIVFSYLEGRRFTELLGAGLCASFILSSGFLKSIGSMLITKYGISEFAMPFATGLIFVIPLLISVFLLDSIPGPSYADEVARTKREPMDRHQRSIFLHKFLYGIIILVFAYIILTFFREIRDNFAYEIWRSLGFGGNGSIFTTAEIPVTAFTLVTLALLAFIRSNIKAFLIIQVFILFAFVIVLCSSLFYLQNFISGKAWMILVGAGLYIGYVPFNAFLFERMIAVFQYKSNIGFVMYICDSFGYLASLSVIFIKNFTSPGISWFSFFLESSIWLSVAGILLMLSSIYYFNWLYKKSLKQIRYEPSFKNGPSIYPSHSRPAINE